MASDVAKTKLHGIVHNNRLSANESSKLNKLCRDVKKLRQNVAEAIESLSLNLDQGSNLEQHIVLTQQSRDYQQLAKQLRLGGSCIHGADKGPNCKRCISEHGRLTGPYAGFPDGLEVGDYWFHVLEGRSSKPANSFVGELDRISAVLQEVDETLKEIDLQIKELGKRSARFKRIRLSRLQPSTLMQEESDQSSEDELGHIRMETHVDVDLVAMDSSDIAEGHKEEMEESSDEFMSADESRVADSDDSTRHPSKKDAGANFHRFSFLVDDLTFILRCASTETGYRQALQCENGTEKALHITSVRQLSLAVEEHLLKLTGRKYRIQKLHCAFNQSRVSLVENESLVSCIPFSPQLIPVEVELTGNPTVSAETSFTKAYIQACSNSEMILNAHRKFRGGIGNSGDPLLDRKCSIMRHIAVDTILGKFDQQTSTDKFTVSLAGVGLEPSSLLPVLSALRYRNSIEKVDISRNPIGVLGIAAMTSFAATLSNLVSLDISYTTFGNGAITEPLALGKLASCPALKHLNLSGLPIIHVWTHKERCSTTCSDFRKHVEAHVALLSTAIAQLCNLAFLGLDHVFDFRSSNCTQVCEMGVEATNAALKILTATIPSWPVVAVSFTSNTLLYTTSCASFLRALLGHTTELDTAYMRVIDERTGEKLKLSNILKSVFEQGDSKNSIIEGKIQTLNLSCCALRKNSIEGISQSLVSKAGFLKLITELYLAGCSLDVETGLHLIKAIELRKKNTGMTLRKLSLRNNSDLFAHVEVSQSTPSNPPLMNPDQEQLIDKLINLQIPHMDLFNTGLSWYIVQSCVLGPRADRPVAHGVLEIGSFWGFPVSPTRNDLQEVVEGVIQQAAEAFSRQQLENRSVCVRVSQRNAEWDHAQVKEILLHYKPQLHICVETVSQGQMLSVKFCSSR